MFSFLASSGLSKCDKRRKINEHYTKHSVEKRENHSHQKKNREINSLVTSLEKNVAFTKFFIEKVWEWIHVISTPWRRSFRNRKVLHHFCKNGVLLPTSTNIHFASIWSFSILKCLSKVRTKFLVLPNFKLYFVRILGVPLQNFSIEFHEIICKT